MTAVGKANKEIRTVSFEAAVNCFIRAMRVRSFIQADLAILEKYGDDMRMRVTGYCFQNGVTIRLKNGRLDLAPKYKRVNTTIKIQRADQ